MSTTQPLPPDTRDAQSEGGELAGDAAIRRRLLIATSALGGAGLLAAAVPFVKSLEPSAAARAAGDPVEVDISALGPGELKTVVWRGKPVWLLKRTSDMVASLGRDTALLADATSLRSDQPAACRNRYRSLEPQLAVIVAVCTHLGCTPNLERVGDPGTAWLGNDWPGGFYCPCHGSKFDLAGRVFKNVPAPTNLVIPPYAYESPTLVRVGDPTG
ncbi:MAG: ubiquinol-cytochrome reductase [Betaproteobacteria bacterium]|nr:ubiquinol-cytochrome reductase [Betaproteobacteria bacterium]MEA3155229.1 ubiquinol-cytochrome c reductase iron-sulfur subunit [Betaproteobacteria bacterium]